MNPQGPYSQNPDPTTGYYPPMPPNYPPPPKKSNTGLIVFIVIGSILLMGAIGSTIEKSKSTVPQTVVESTPNNIVDTPTPTPVPKTWTTTHTYTGNGDKQTETFTTGNDWKITWNCQADNAPLYVSVYNADTNDMVDWDAVSTTCKNTPTTGETVQHGGGNLYLKIISGIDWTLTIQELK